MNRTHLFLFAAFAALALLIAACGPSTPQPPQPRTLTLTVEGNGSGTVTFDPAGNPAGACTDDCTKTFNNGATVTLTAQPAEGSTAAWGGVCENATGNTCQVQMTADRSVTVTFTAGGGEEPGVTSVTINQANQTLAPGATVQLSTNVVVTGGAATTVTWESDDTEVATVSATGLVTAVAEGVATISATSTVDGTKSDSITVTVSQDAPPVVESVSIDQGDNLSLGVGDTQTLTATVAPAGAAQGVTWQSSNTGVATVDAASGAVTAVAAGTATITATSTADASKTDTISVTVTGTDGNRLTLTFVGSGSGEVFVDGNRVTETRTLTFAPGRTIPLQLPADSTAIAWGGACSTSRNPTTGQPSDCQLVMDGDKSVSISFSANAQTASASIVANSVDPAGTSSNDAEEFLGELVNNNVTFQEGYMLLSSNTLELTFDPRGSGVDQLVGLRFVNLGIPQGATILDAYIQFRSVQSSADDNAQEPLTLTFRVQDSVNPPFFNTIIRNISNRSTLDASVSWTPPAWAGQQGGLAQRSPNLTPLVQALVSNGSWNSAANAIAFIISSNDTENRRDAQSFERLPAAAPQLVIKYEVP